MIEKIDLKSFNLSEIDSDFSGVTELIRLFKITLLLKKIDSRNLFNSLYIIAKREFKRNYNDFFVLYDEYCIDEFEYDLYTLSVLLDLSYHLVFEYYYNLLRSYIGCYLQQSFNLSYFYYSKYSNNCPLNICNDEINYINYFQEKNYINYLLNKINNILEIEIGNYDIYALIDNFQNFTSKKYLYSYFGKDSVKNFLVNKFHIFIEYKNEFLRSDRLICSKEDKILIKNAITSVIKQNDIAEIKFVYEIIRQKDHKFLINNQIFDTNSFFNVLEFLFQNEFFFTYPYISTSCLQFSSKKQLLIDCLDKEEILYIDDIYDLAGKINYEINNIFEVINLSNRIFVNKEKTIHFVYDTKMREFIEDIERKIYDELLDINDTIPLIALKSLIYLEFQGYDWNEWYIYSILLKKGKLFDIRLSTNNYKKAIPFISIKGHYKNNSVKKWLKDNKHLCEIHIQDMHMEKIEESIFLESLEDLI